MAPKKNLDSIDKALQEQGVNLTDAEKDRVNSLVGSTDKDVVEATQQVLDERVGPAAASLQDYPKVADLVPSGRSKKDDDTEVEEERPTGVSPAASVEEAEKAGAATARNPRGTETVQSNV